MYMIHPTKTTYQMIKPNIINLNPNFILIFFNNITNDPNGIYLIVGTIIEVQKRKGGYIIAA